MELIHSVHGGSVWVHAIRDHGEFPYLPFDGRPYLCLLVNFDYHIDEEFTDSIARRIVLSNCRFAACAGIESKYCHDRIDWVEAGLNIALMEESDDDEAEDRYFLVTTWHDDEDIDDQYEFIFKWGLIDLKHPEHYLILFLGENVEEEKRYIEGLKQYA